MLVAQAHGQAIKLGLGHIFHGRRSLRQCQLTPHASIKILRATGFGIGFGADAQHGHGMAHAGKRVQRFAADALGRGIRRDQPRVRRLQSLERLEQSVVFGIRNLRVVQHIVVVCVLVELVAQQLQL